MNADNYLQVTWEQPKCMSDIEPYLKKKTEAYHGTYDIGLDDQRRKCLVFVIHEGKNAKGKSMGGKKRSFIKAQIYEEFKNRPSLLQFVRRVHLNKKCEGLPHGKEKWAIIFDHADMTLRQYLDEQAPWKTTQVVDKAKESPFLISVIREIFTALSELHSLGYLICLATPEHFFIQNRKNGPPRICIADVNQLIRKATNGQNELIDDFKQLEWVIIYILTGKWKVLDYKQSMSHIAESFITFLQKSQRITISSALKHPLFWGSTKLIGFYVGTSEFLKSIRLTQTLRNAFKVVGLDLFGNRTTSGDYDWKNCIDTMVITSMEQASPSNRKYVTTNIIELIRLIRNIHNHPNQQLPNLLTDEGIANYIELRVPKLTMSIYSLMYDKYNRDARFNHYFFKDE